MTGQRQAVLAGATRPVGTPDLSARGGLIQSSLRDDGCGGASLAQVKVPLRGAAFPNVAFQRPQSLLLPTYLRDFGPKPPERGAQAHLRAAIPGTFTLGSNDPRDVE